MENTNEKNREMTAQESLKLIGDMLDSSRRDILQSSAKHFLLWGLLLAATSIVIYFLWHTSGSPKWNMLWFAMAVIGFPIAMLVASKDKVPQSIISRQIGQVWLVYAAFVVGISIIASTIVPLPVSLTLLIVFVLGFAECISGLLLRNWPIIIGGFLLGIGGVIAAALLKTEAQMFIFTFGGLILVLTGLIIKIQYR